ncbi:uncharacterized protein LOC118404317 [Branchiostoma floridae]|uniref:Uncharacterized protein LOC118404317 n=1 Tax=Branchiostoma floridae TaxID=7739 RepID=A0A9J7KHK0_BRAFL|nr:uncharacterized protein LOC118404317 [Branchiostoma floridae]
MASVKLVIHLLVLGLAPGTSYAFFNYPPGSWGPWGPWSNECGCSDTSRYRTRNCVTIYGQVVTDAMQMMFTSGCGNFGMNVGDNMETVACPECSAIPELETWNAWSECSDPCLGQPYRSRVRRCIYPNDPYGELPPVGSCDGSLYDQQHCDTTCVQNAEWDLWSSWNYCPCNAIPNLTKRVRWRGCIDGDHLGILYVDDFNCGEGDTTQTKLCTAEEIPECTKPVSAKSLGYNSSYYEWSSWGSWTPCPDLCLHDPTVITSRYRVCTYIYNGQTADQLLCGVDFYQSEACPKVPYDECNDSYVPVEFERTPCYEEGAGAVFYKGCAMTCTCADATHFTCEDMCSNLPPELFQYDQNGCRYIMTQPYADMPYNPDTCCPHLECDPAFAAGNCPELDCEENCKRGYKVERGYDGCLRCHCLSTPTIAEEAYGAAIDHNEARARMCPAHLLCVGSCDTGYARNEHGCLTCECNTPDCPAMTCDLDCPGGLAKDAYGCELCQCALFDDGYCTHHGQHYKNGQKFLSDCEGEGGCCEMICRCLANHVTCETICPAVPMPATENCPSPVLVTVPEVCCQQYACNHDDTISARRELGLVPAKLTAGDCVSIDDTCELHCLDGYAQNRQGCDICQCSTVDPGSCIHNGNVYRNGQAFVDPETCDQRCTCKDGDVVCELYCSAGDAPAEDCFKLELPGLCCTKWVCSEQEMYATYDEFGIQVNRNVDGSTLTVFVVRQNSHHIAAAGEEETPCETARTTALNTNDTLTGGYVPTCSDTGAYMPVQCHGSTGECWCVDGQGQEVSGTRVGAGYALPDCSDYTVLSCPVKFCTVTCQHGFAVGEDGCHTCDCKAEPGPLGHLVFTIDFPGLGYTSDMVDTSSAAFLGTAQEIETNIKSELLSNTTCYGVSVSSLSKGTGNVGVIASGAITAGEDEMTPAHTLLTMSSLTGHVGSLQMGNVDFPDASCCPSGFTHRNGSGRCYKFDMNNEFLSWEDSKALCEAAGADLLSIEDEDENAYIHHYVVENILSADHPQYIHWTSGNDLQQQGHFVWATGGVVNYRRRPGDSVRDYAEKTAKRCIAGGDLVAAATLDQTRCSFQLYYICERASLCPARCAP